MDNNCDVHFSHGGCLVQDQVLGKVIARGPKVARLFPLQFTIPRTLSLIFIIFENKANIWHTRLSHPNNVILSHLMKHGFLGNINKCSANSSSLDCSTCKLGKVKHYLFLLMVVVLMRVLRLYIVIFGVLLLSFHMHNINIS